MSAREQGDGCGFLDTAELEQALEGTLSRTRLAELERHIEGGCGPCALLLADIEVFSAALREGARDGERAEFESRAGMLVRRLEREAARHAPRGRRFGARWGWAAAAAAVLVLAVGLGVLRLSGLDGIAVPLPGGGTRIEQPMAFSLPPTLRGGADAGETWRAAARAYEAERFAEAARLLAGLDEDDPGAADAALYRGIALLAAGDAAAAGESLAEARELAQRDDLPTGSIDWHAALAALIEGDLDGARRDLERARDAGGAYADEATVLLGEF